MDDQKYEEALRYLEKSYQISDLDQYPKLKYDLLCFESEILYYNGLFHYGADRAQKALRLSEELSHPLYAGNALNLMGINLEKEIPGYEVIEIYREALDKLPDHPDPQYTRMAHLLSNMGQLELLENQLDSAYVHLTRANAYAIRDKMYRTAAINYASLSKLAILQKDLKVARDMTDSCKYYTRQSGNPDLFLFLTQAIIEYNVASNDKKEAEKNARNGIQFMKEHPEIPIMSKLDFSFNTRKLLNTHLNSMLVDSLHKLESNWYNQVRHKEREIQNVLLKQVEKNNQLLQSKEDLQRKSEKALADQKRQIQWLWTGIFFIIFLALAVAVFYLQKRRSDARALEHHKAELKYQHEITQSKARMDSILSERGRINQEFHDGIAPNLSSLKLITQALSLKNPNDEMLKNLPQIIDHTIHETRSLLNDMNPLPLQNLGLHHAVRLYIEQMSLAYPARTIELHSNIENLRLNDETELHLYRMVQEGVHNALKHSKSESIIVLFELSGRKLSIQIIDRSNHSSEKSPFNRQGNGIKNLENRALIINASLSISQNPNETKIEIVIFLPEWQDLTSV